MNWLKRLVCCGLCVVSFPAMAACSEARQAAASAAAIAKVRPNWMGGTVEVTDNSGTKTVPLRPRKIAAFDLGISTLLDDLGVQSDFCTTPEEVARLEPDLVVMGAHSQYRPARIADISSGVAVVDLAPRPEKPLDEELVRQAQVLGKIFDREELADQLEDDFGAALKRARRAAKKNWTAAVIQVDDGKLVPQGKDGGKIFGPVMEMVGLTPVTMQDKPDVILVSEPSPLEQVGEYQSAIRQLDKDPTMKNVPAVKKGNIYVAPYSMPDGGTLTSYTEMFNELANHWSAIY
ncbi:ABC transporter substrate-binding protein [Corynebacterium tuscaniense]|nr:ABC transporter substrate-binding protein [Corynebacterium tuscaniense]